jgi:hypothetical protein
MLSYHREASDSKTETDKHNSNSIRRESVDVLQQKWLATEFHRRGSGASVASEDAGDERAVDVSEAEAKVEVNGEGAEGKKKKKSRRKKLASALSPAGKTAGKLAGAALGRLSGRFSRTSRGSKNENGEGAADGEESGSDCSGDEDDASSKSEDEFERAAEMGGADLFERAQQQTDSALDVAADAQKRLSIASVDED